MVFLSSVSIVSGSTKKHITHNMTYMYNYLINNHHYTRLSTQGMAEAEAVLSRVRVWAATGPGSCHQSPPSRVQHQHQPPTLMQTHAVSLRQHPASCSHRFLKPPTGLWSLRRSHNFIWSSSIHSTFYTTPSASSAVCILQTPGPVYWLRARGATRNILAPYLILKVMTESSLSKLEILPIYIFHLHSN